MKPSEVETYRYLRQEPGPHRGGGSRGGSEGVQLNPHQVKKSVRFQKWGCVRSLGIHRLRELSRHAMLLASRYMYTV